ncbi:putative mitochondrial ferredoxin, 2fe-2s-like protein [Leptomonas pyrrhocoris]|uniref:Putative mitochondrial ferredoxin, 2fe-2s-like protein n=1 Tax=Leptomonas pyrrhocoris TaxID=157538 RepID=A0A0N0DRH3_LEPPY|nr:putative mitochondrial ferredoxin, 2fe-2s-like protein [Leptomonas pyrrhocoris]KPA74461.1 putative mitochondrial ferredoxin, 2fe-2s-like protein [Leptomonas pyrrhocoris]|eukprot:XP_015652900.1 putative mitochondrial ferredoxin, 2fe-2s-like protein [Leptomonas pyrrhocoris]
MLLRHSMMNTAVPRPGTVCKLLGATLLTSSRMFFTTTPSFFTPNKVQVCINASDGTPYKRAYDEGTSLMEALRDDPTLPVDAAGACSGTCQCSTCHVLMRSPEWFAKTEKLYPVSDAEQDCLDKTPGATDASRLGCQVVLTEALDGLELDLPKTTIDLRWQAAYQRATKK